MMPRVSLSAPSLFLAALPSLPPTVRDVDVPPLFRERFILSGYRPPGLPWRCYVLSLFQIHNETLSVWSHLLAGILGFRLQGPEGQGFSVDVSSLPLVLYAFSAVTYLSCSAAAHLLQSHSETAHYSLFFLDYVGVAIYQYGCALALCLYSSDTTWTQSMLGQVFLPAAALLAWLSCTACCYAKLRFRRPYPLHRKLCQVLPMGVAYLLDISPVAHRLATVCVYVCVYMCVCVCVCVYMCVCVMLFLLSAFFFSCPVPERCSPGGYDIVGHGHQLFHFLLCGCTLAQQEALLQDFLWRRPALLRVFGEQHLLLACASFPLLTLCCALTALAMRQRAHTQLRKEQR
uniref:Progestin and adipoQ receptor family member 8 n=1 Tax=Sander lucioperca TaxID=283035 RepID=A0A8D0D2G0_SANLU